MKNSLIAGQIILMANYELRSAAVISGLLTRVKRTRRLKFYAFKCNDVNAALYHEYEALFDEAENKELYAEAIRAAASDFKRNNRLKNRISDFMSKGTCVFVTLTFRDSVLEFTSADTRRQYVRKFLKSCSQYYVANIDFGDLNDREHYHGIVVCENVDMDGWKYGYAYCERIKTTSNRLRLAKYISKLANHAVKETCKRNHLIYSRDMGKILKREEHFDKIGYVNPYW